MGHRITVLAIGSRGDVQPYLPLGRRLRERGHDVSVLTSAGYAPLVREAGLRCVPVDVDVKAALGSGHGQNWLAARRDPLRLAAGLRPLVDAHADRLIEAAEACGDTDAVVCSLLGTLLRPALVPATTPFCFGALQPTYPTGAFPTIQLPHRNSLGRLANRVSHRIVETLLWQGARSVLRRRTRGLPWHAPTTQLRRAGHPVLAGFSRHVVPRPADWPESVHVTGYWFTDLPEAWTPPPALAAFLAAGPPPVFVGFGSMVPGDPGTTAATVRRALRRTGHRGVLLGDPTVEPSDEQVHVVADVPHEWLFPRMSAVVHHGGAGTTAAVLRAGVPSVTTPFFLDQPFWGERLHHLGVATAPVPIRTLTADRLAEAVTEATTTPLMRERARLVGEDVRAERGVDRAADVVEDWLSALSR
jgi:UDP:flavonoid glycosyltransferase YjiC (YdhE family)